MSRPSPLTRNPTPPTGGVGLHPPRMEITISPDRDPLSPIDSPHGGCLSPYTRIGCLEELLSASQILDRWARDRSQIVDQIHHFKTASSPVSPTPFSNLPSHQGLQETRSSPTSGECGHPPPMGGNEVGPNVKDEGLFLKGRPPPMGSGEVGPWQPWLPVFSKDRNCMNKLGWGPPPFAQRQVCAGCHAVTRMVPKKKMPESAIFQIGVGKYRGVILSVRTLSRDLIGYRQSLTPQRVGVRILNQLSHMQTCEPSLAANLPITRFWETLSGIDQYITVSCLIEQLMAQSKIPCEPIFRWAYSCGSDTIVIDETPAYGVGSLKTLIQNPDYLAVTPTAPTPRTGGGLALKTSLIRGLIAQLVTSLHSLSTSDFIHGEPSLASLGFINKLTTYTYSNAKINCPITLVIVPSSQSSISTVDAEGQRHRFYNAGKTQVKDLKGDHLPVQEIVPFLATTHTKAHPPEVCVKNPRSKAFSNPCLPELFECIVMGYRIGSCDELFTTYLRNLGVPLFGSSFDLYMFFTSLMAESVFYHGVISDPVSLSIWKNLWHAQEYETVMSSLGAFHHEPRVETPSFKVVLTLLKPLILRCDALENTWRQVREALEM